MSLPNESKKNHTAAENTAPQVPVFEMDTVPSFDFTESKKVRQFNTANKRTGYGLFIVFALLLLTAGSYYGWGTVKPYLVNVLPNKPVNEAVAKLERAFRNDSLALLDWTKDDVDVFLNAAEEGNRKAQSLLAYCYREGKGVNKDTEKAEEWLRKSAEQGDAWGQYFLGLHITNKKPLTAADIEKALDWYRRSVENGNGKSAQVLAKIYFYGENVKRNTEESEKWIAEAKKHNYDVKDLKDAVAAERESKEADRKMRYEERNAKLTAREHEADAREKELNRRKTVLDNTDKTLTEREQQAAAKEKQNTNTAKSLEEREQKVVSKEGELNELRKELSSIEQKLSAQEDKVVAPLKVPFRRVKITIAGETFEAVRLDIDPAQNSPLVPLGLKKDDVITHINNIRTDLEIHGTTSIRFVKEGKQGEGTIDIP